MWRSFLTLFAITLASGCSVVPPFKSPDWLSKNLLKKQHHGDSEAPMSQLGAALPAMKPGDERELKIVAADEMVKQGYWNEAIELYREAETMAPGKPKLDAQLAPALAGAGQYAESLQRYRRLTVDQPKNASLVNNLAYTLMESGDLASAEAEFRRSLAIDPQFERAAVNLGLLLARQRRYDEAVAALTPVVGTAAAHHNVGVVAIDLGDEPTAIQYFQLAASGSAAPKATHEFLATLTQSSVPISR